MHGVCHRIHLSCPLRVDSARSLTSRLVPLQLTGIYAHPSSSSSVRVPALSLPSGFYIKRLVTHPSEFVKDASVEMTATANDLSQSALVYTSENMGKLIDGLCLEEDAVNEKFGTSGSFNHDLLVAVQPIMQIVQQAMKSQPADASMSSMFTAQSATTMIKAGLDSEAATNVADSILEVGEKMVEKLESIRNMDQVQSMLSMAQTDAQASLLLSTIEQVDADATLSLASDVLTGSCIVVQRTAEYLLITACVDYFLLVVDMDARKRLIETFQSKVIDFLSAYIPTLSVPSVGGVKDEVEYYIAGKQIDLARIIIHRQSCSLGLNMSGFKLNKDGISVRMANNVDGRLFCSLRVRLPM
jgi:hypothetical protein